jgi:hypothetical protein
VQKALWVTTTYDWKFLGLTPGDFLVAAGVCLLFALTLAARAWVKLNEPRMLTHGRRPDAEDPAGLDLGEWRNAPTDRTEAAAGR